MRSLAEMAAVKDTYIPSESLPVRWEDAVNTSVVVVTVLALSGFLYLRRKREDRPGSFWVTCVLLILPVLVVVGGLEKWGVLPRTKLPLEVWKERCLAMASTRRTRCLADLEEYQMVNYEPPEREYRGP